MLNEKETQSGHIHVKSSVFMIFFSSTGGGKRKHIFDNCLIYGETR